MESEEVKNLEDLVEFIVDWWHKEYDHLEFTSKCFLASELRRKLANEVEEILKHITV